LMERVQRFNESLLSPDQAIPEQYKTSNSCLLEPGHPAR
jgi:hypothetical protein